MLRGVGCNPTADAKARRVLYVRGDGAEYMRYTLFHRRTRASYVYNVCLAWYNVVLTHGSTQA